MTTIADIIRHFSSTFTLPVQVDDVVAEFRARGIMDEVYFWDVESDIDILKGRATHWSYPPGPSLTEVRCLDVDISANLDIRWRRLVSCKELLHLLDRESIRVNSDAQLDHLIEKIILPASLQDPFTDGAATNSDRVAELQAAAILFPFSAREVLLPYVADGRLSFDQVVAMADLPPRYVAYVLSDVWPGIHEILTR